MNLDDIKKYTTTDARDFPSDTGVYAITFENNPNKNIYIGSASSFKNKSVANGFNSRWKSHIRGLIKNTNETSDILKSATQKYGIDNIRFQIIEMTSPENCIKREQY